MNLQKTVIAALVVGLVAAFFFFDLGHYLSLDYLKQSQASFEAIYARRPLVVALSFYGMSTFEGPVMSIRAVNSDPRWRCHLWPVVGHVDRVVRRNERGHAGVSDGPLCPARQHRGALSQPLGRDQRRRGQRRGVLPVHAAAGAAGALLRHQPGDGPDQDEDADLLLGQSAWHAGRHGGVCERGHAAGATGVAARHFEPGADWFVCAAGPVPAGGAQGGRGFRAPQGLRPLGQREAETL